MVKGSCFNKKNPIVLGVTVKAGILKIGTPVCIPDQQNLKIGKVSSIELNKKNITSAREKEGQIAIKIDGDPHITFGRHFEESN